MAITEHASGTRTAGTPPEGGFTALGTSGDTTDGVYQFFIDCSNMANGDSIDIQVLEKVISSGTSRVIFTETLSNAQSDPIWASPSFVFMHGWTLQLKQTAGTARSFDWSQRKVA